MSDVINGGPLSEIDQQAQKFAQSMISANGMDAGDGQAIEHFKAQFCHDLRGLQFILPPLDSNGVIGSDASGLDQEFNEPTARQGE